MEQNWVKQLVLQANWLGSAKKRFLLGIAWPATPLILKLWRQRISGNGGQPGLRMEVQASCGYRTTLFRNEESFFLLFVRACVKNGKGRDS